MAPLSQDYYVSFKNMSISEVTLTHTVEHSKLLMNNWRNQTLKNAGETLSKDLSEAADRLIEERRIVGKTMLE